MLSEFVVTLVIQHNFWATSQM